MKLEYQRLSLLLLSLTKIIPSFATEAGLGKDCRYLKPIYAGGIEPPGLDRATEKLEMAGETTQLAPMETVNSIGNEKFNAGHDIRNIKLVGQADSSLPYNVGFTVHSENLESYKARNIIAKNSRFEDSFWPPPSAAASPQSLHSSLGEVRNKHLEREDSRIKALCNQFKKHKIFNDGKYTTRSKQIFNSNIKKPPLYRPQIKKLIKTSILPHINNLDLQKITQPAAGFSFETSNVHRQINTAKKVKNLCFRKWMPTRFALQDKLDQASKIKDM
ncbi:hypothetical protein BY996DRAFT_6851000 [Phakopsora pachyrhizi]|nr:hypothetical protein BY996DRAFT_6851000 [Phakopsora pachyrhizi]